MKRLVCMSTGNLYKEGKRDINKDIELCSKIKGIDGVEVIFPRVKSLLEFKLSRKNKKFLNTLKFNTIHLPFNIEHGKPYHIGKNPLTKKIIKKAKEIYDEIGAKNMNIHPHQVEDFRIINDPYYSFSIENEVPYYSKGIKAYDKILKRYEHIKFVLDTTHAMECNELKELAELMKGRIYYTHLSASCCEKHHLALHILREDYLKQLKVVCNQKYPVVAETWMGTRDVEFFNKEIRFIRKWMR